MNRLAAEGHAHRGRQAPARSRRSSGSARARRACACSQSSRTRSRSREAMRPGQTAGPSHPPGMRSSTPGRSRNEHAFRSEPRHHLRDHRRDQRELQDSGRHRPELPQIAPALAGADDEQRGDSSHENRQEWRDHHFNSVRCSILTSGLFRVSAMTSPRPIAASAAATAMTKSARIWPRSSRRW